MCNRRVVFKLKYIIQLMVVLRYLYLFFQSFVVNKLLLEVKFVEGEEGKENREEIRKSYWERGEYLQQRI